MKGDGATVTVYVGRRKRKEILWKEFSGRWGRTMRSWRKIWKGRRGRRSGKRSVVSASCLNSERVLKTIIQPQTSEQLKMNLRTKPKSKMRRLQRLIKGLQSSATSSLNFQLSRPLRLEQPLPLSQSCTRAWHQCSRAWYQCTMAWHLTRTALWAVTISQVQEQAWCTLPSLWEWTMARSSQWWATR